MNSFNIADELDEAVNNVLTGVETAGVNTDLEMGELAGLAMELQQLPQPEFKAQLKAQLIGRTVSDYQDCGATSCISNSNCNPHSPRN